MNSLERQMLDMLKLGRDRYGVVAVKAEFEAEGTRPDEFLRLLDLAKRADLKVALKIGGCEAISDLLSSRLYGVDFIVAPMVETPYALSKFIDAKNKTYSVDEQSDTDFLFNLETQTSFENLDEMVAMAQGQAAGIVFGRGDFTLSRGLPRHAVNERSITDAVVHAAAACAQANLDFVVGGAVSVDSIAALREVRAARLDRFETRKVIFDGAAIESNDVEAGIENATAFELAWLRNKREYYKAIVEEDRPRIELMESRIAAQAAPAAAKRPVNA